MTSIKSKSETLVVADQLAAVLHTFADDIEQGAVSIDGVRYDLAALLKVNVSVEPEGQQYRLKLKAVFQSDGPVDKISDGNEASTPTGEEERSATSASASYKTIKKRMKRDFKAIHESLSMGRLPKMSIIESFTMDSSLMVSFPGKGDESYASFQGALSLLRHSVALSDASAAWGAAVELSEIKRVCHAKHK